MSNNGAGIIVYDGSCRLSASGLIVTKSSIRRNFGKPEFVGDGHGRWVAGQGQTPYPLPAKLDLPFRDHDLAFRRLAPQIMLRLVAAGRDRASIPGRERTSLRLSLRILTQGSELSVHWASLVFEHTDKSGIFRATSWCDPEAGVKHIFLETKALGDTSLDPHWHMLIEDDLNPEIRALVAAPFAWGLRVVSA